jgi:hypothetical protein
MAFTLWLLEKTKEWKYIARAKEKLRKSVCKGVIKLNVKEVIAELIKYPEDIEVEMSMKIDLEVSLSSYERPMKCNMFPKGKV